MEGKISHKFSGKLVARIFVLALIITGMFFMGNSVGTVQAEEAVTDTVLYVKEDNVSEYRSGDSYTYPKPTETGKENWIFAGWYNGNTTDAVPYKATELKSLAEGAEVYAKYVPEEVLSVKFQTSAGTNAASETSNLRMVSTVDSADYTTVGFSITANGKTLVTKSGSVYKRIKSAMEGLEYGYSPIIFDTDSEYFMTATISNIKNKNFDRTYFVQPYWITQDGTTVYGVSRNVRVSDSYNEIANIPVRLYAEQVEAGDITVAYPAGFTFKESEIGNVIAADKVTVADDGAGTITITLTEAITNANGMLLNLRFAIGDGASSNNTFAMTGTGVADYNYNVYSTSYDGTPDTSWYTEFAETDSEFVIATANDLYGLAQLVNDNTETFAGEKTVYLGADITVNKGAKEEILAKVSDTDTENDPHVWTVIGSTNAFAGMFDGDGHTISGLYLTGSDTSKTYGLFGTTAAGSVLQDFHLENSYFELAVTSRTPLGSIVGNFNGTIKEVFSDAVVVSTRGKLGGIVGDVEQDSGALSNIECCWYDGQVILDADIATRANEAVGGVIGGVYNNGTLNVRDCVTTADVFCTYDSYAKSGNKAIAGVVGYTVSGTTVDATNIIMAGNVTVRCGNDTDGYTILTGNSSSAENSGRGVALYFGYGTGTLSLTNAYCIESNDYAYNRPTVTATNYQNALTEENLNGHLGYKNTMALGYYDANSNPTGNWLVRATATDLADGIPVPKCFADNDAIDVKWYYDNYVTATNEETGAEYKKYTIATAEELYGFADVSASYNFSGDEVYLGADITANTGNASAWSAIVKADRNWTPIGTKDNAFAGKFDGAGHTISGIYYVGTDEDENHGLFGTTAAGSTLKDFRLENSHFELTDVTLKTPLGSVAGVLNGDLENVYSDANVVSVRGKIGGLVGIVDYASDSVTNHITHCWHNGKIELNKNDAVANYENVGGVVGLVNAGDLQIISCLKTGEIKVSFSEPNYTGNKAIGGLVGHASGNVSISDTIMAASMLGQYMSDGTYITMTGEDKDIETSGRGISLSVGYGTETSITLTNVYLRNSNKYMIAWKNGTNSSNYSNRLAQSKLNGHVAYSNTCSYDSDTDTHQGISYYHPVNNPNGAWVIREKANNIEDGCPIPKVFADEWIDVAWYYDNVTAYTDEEAGAEDFVNPADEYTISTAEELYGLSVIATEVGDIFENDTIYLADDIEMNAGLASDWAAGNTEGVRAWTPVGTETKPFAGIFDGEGHTISGIYMSTSKAYAGLFGNVADGTIQNLKLENSFFESTIAEESHAMLGSIAGNAYGTLKNIYSNAIVHSTGVRNGGLVGCTGQDQEEYSLNMESCWFAGELKVTQVNNVQKQSGGLVGYGRYLTIDTCLNSGDIVLEHYTTATALKNPNADIGAFVGTMNGSGSVSIVNSINAANIDLIWNNTGKDTAPNGFKFYGLIGRPSSSTWSASALYNAGTINLKIYDKDVTTVSYDYFESSDSSSGLSGITNVSGDVAQLYGSLATKLWFEGEIRDDGGDAYWRETDGASLPVPVTLSDKEWTVVDATATRIATLSDSFLSFQGGCLVGEYFYQAQVMDETAGTVQIVKYDLQGQEILRSNDLVLHHANDITYNSATNQLVVCHTQKGSYNLMSLITPDTWEIETITLNWATEKFGPNGITYRNGKYAATTNSYHNIHILDTDFNEITKYGTLKTDPVLVKTASTAQGICSDDNYIYCLFYDSTNKGTEEEPSSVEQVHGISVFDWNGNRIKDIRFSIPGIKHEPESISVVDGKFYVEVNAGNDINPAESDGNYLYVLELETN